MALLQGLIKKLNGEDEDPAAPSGMPGSPANPNTGIGGVPDVSALAQQASAPATAAAPAYDMSRVMGVDAGKFNDPNKHDFKYDTQRTLSQFDPKAGFTPDAIDALNKLGYGTFSSGGGDKVSLTGAKNAKDAADFANQDWIGAYDAQNGDTKWNFGGGGVAQQQERAAPQGGGGMFAGSSIAPLLQGNASSNIQSALGNIGGAGDDSLIQRLIAQLRGAQ